jgi:hypothetical protein
MRTRRISFVIAGYLAVSAPAFAADPPADTIWRLEPASKSVSCIDSAACAEGYQRFISMAFR